MSVRKLLLLLGVLFVIAGLGLSFLWFNRVAEQAPQVVQTAPKGPAQLVAVRALPVGTLLREGDMAWKEVQQAQMRPGQLLRGEVSDADYLGAITRKEFAEGEPLTAADLVKPNDRRFLAAVLRPGYRAVSISVDAPNSASGSVLPGDFVDVILTQNFGDNIASSANRSVGETVLHDVRVVAVEQSIGDKAKPPVPNNGAATGAEPRIPKTISLELNERDAQALLVAGELGRMHLAVRSLEGAGMERADKESHPGPTWASDVSQAVAVLANIGMAKTELANREAKRREAEKREIERRDAEKREAARREITCTKLQKSSGSPVSHFVRCPPHVEPVAETVAGTNES